jgi:hypothetical protein
MKKTTQLVTTQFVLYIQYWAGHIARTEEIYRDSYVILEEMNIDMRMILRYIIIIIIIIYSSFAPHGA